MGALRFGIADGVHKMIGNQNFLLKNSSSSVRDLVGAIYDRIVRGK